MRVDLRKGTANLLLESLAHAEASEWVPWRQFDPDVLAANMAVLEKRHPALHALLDSHPSLNGLHLRVDAARLPEAAVLRNGGSFELLLSAQALQISIPIQESVIRDAPGGEYAAVFWALGCNLGFSLQLLVSHLRRAPQKLVVVLEPDLRLFAAALAARPIQAALASNRFEWVVGPESIQQARSCFERCNLFAVERMEVLPSASAIFPSMKSVWSKLRHRFFSEWKKEFQRCYQETLNAAREHYRSKPPGRVQSILAISLDEDESKAIPYIQKRFLQTCSLLGIRILYHHPCFRGNITYLRTVANERPDLLLFINKSPGEFTNPDLLERLGAPRMIWLIDDPNCFVEERFTPLDYVFTWDEAYAADLIAKGAYEVDAFPYVADLDENQARFEERFAAPVSYIGQVKAFQPHELGLDENTAELARCVGRIKAAQPHRTYQSIMLTEQKRFGLQLIQREEDEVPRYVRYAIYIVANAARRIAVLEQALPFGLKLYGNADWEILLQDHPLLECYAGPADPEREVPRIFRSSAINLNIHSLQALTSLNQRDFNCPLAGGFLLTDWVVGADRFFQPDQELIFYHGLDDLQNKIDYFLQNEDERRRVIERGRQRVLREHTYAARVPTVLETLERRMRDRHDRVD